MKYFKAVAEELGHYSIVTWFTVVILAELAYRPIHKALNWYMNELEYKMNRYVIKDSLNNYNGLEK